LDATYSVGDALSGVGVYSREILWGLAAAHPEARFLWWYRPHRYWRAYDEALPANVSRGLLLSRGFFHGLNQRLPNRRQQYAVTTFHDLFVMTGEYSTSEFRKRFTEQARDAAARSDRIIAVSEFTKRQVVELLGVPAERVTTVHHGVNKLGGPQPALSRSRMVLTVGAMQTRKNTARLVEAFEALDNSWQLVLAGSGGYGVGEILARIEKSPARERIRMPGYVAPGQLAELYQQASIFAFPSLDEGFGMPVLDAMAAGVPTIASNRSAMPEVAGDAALLVDPEDTEALADGLRRLAEDEDLRRDLTDKGRARAKLFTWEKAVRETWDVYRELLT
jgi:glycosyltransferase involved in cell wall biosynthesis